MRLKVRRFLKGGEFLVSFETIGFNPEEADKMEKFGMPVVDLSAIGLGLRPLNRIDTSINCQSLEEAKQKIGHVKAIIRARLGVLLAQVDNVSGERTAKISAQARLSILGVTCAFAAMILSASWGGIPSQQIPNWDRQPFAAAQQGPVEERVANEAAGMSSEAGQTSTQDPVMYCRAGESEDGMARANAKTSSQGTGSASLTSGRPDFTITVVPEILARYSDWGSDPAESTGSANHEHFKLILTPQGGFEGPVTLGVLSSSPLLDKRLYPAQIEKLPGSSTLLISFSPETLPHICRDITVIARGRTKDGDLITHERRLTLAVRQRSSYRGPVWHVSTHGSDQSGDGGWGSPFRTIQRAIECAQAGDTVLVERGRYHENLDLTNKDKVLVASHFVFDQRESTIRSTIIEAKEPGWVVTIGRCEQVTLRGFTIQKGKGEAGALGGGIYCYNSSPSILDNIITKNENHSGYGAGIYCYDSEPSILRNQIIQNYNYDGQGAGIYCYQSAPDIQQNSISENYSSGGGSGIHLLDPTAVKIIGNLIHGQSGSAATVLRNTGTAGEFQVLSNTISHNQATAVKYFGDHWSFENNIITLNEGYGLFTLEGMAHFAHNNIWGNVSGSDTINYCGFGENPTNGNGNISRDPCFGNPLHGNFHLCFNSPCIDSGDPNHPVPPQGGARIDMGAFEYTHPEMICGDVNRDGFIDYGDIDHLVNFLWGKVSIADPYRIGDVNGDDQVDKGDLSYLYDFLYYYGPEPCGEAKPEDRLSERQ